MFYLVKICIFSMLKTSELVWASLELKSSTWFACIFPNAIFTSFYRIGKQAESDAKFVDEN